MSYKLSNEVEEVLNKVPEFKGLLPVIASIEDKEKQSQNIDILLNIDSEPLDINTSHGWNQHVRRGNIKELILKGVLPTDDNLKKYQGIVNSQFEEKNENLNPYSVPVVFRGDDKKVISVGLV